MAGERRLGCVARWVPVWVAGTLIVALFLHFLAGRFDWIAFILVMVTQVAILGVVVLGYSVPRTARSRAQLGFTRDLDYWRYRLSGKGIPAGIYFLGLSCVAVSLISGWSDTDPDPFPFWADTGPGLVAVFDLLLLIAYGWVTRKWPADEEE